MVQWLCWCRMVRVNETGCVCGLRTCDQRELHVLTQSCPVGRSSELAVKPKAAMACPVAGGAPALPVAAAVNPNRPVADPSARSMPAAVAVNPRSEEHTSELQSLMRNSFAGFCLKKQKRLCLDD